MDWPIPHKRQRGRPATARARRQGTISAPEMASSTKLQAGSQFLIKFSWDPGWLTSVRRATARDQLPRGDTRNTWDGAPTVHPGNRVAGKGEVIRCTTLLGSVHLSSTWSPEMLRPGKYMQPRACFRQFPCRATWSLSSVDQESTHTMSRGKTSVVHTTNTPHTHQWYLFAVFLPPCITIEQVSLNKWSPSPPCVRAKFRSWRDFQTEEAKIKKREPL